MGRTPVDTMTPMSQFDQIAERVERLLLRHEELQRTNHLLQQQVEALLVERDALRSRLQTAKARMDVLLERLPEGAPNQNATLQGKE